jgi:nucleotide-binding universal stress UspA family protein
MSNGEPVQGARRRILVGVDGSEDGLRAVRYALREALVSDSDVWIVNVVDESVMVSGLWDIVIPVEELEQVGRRLVQDALAVVAEEGFPSDRVTSEVLPGLPAEVLAGLSRHAELLVVGRRSLTGIERMFVGSTSVAVAGRAECPVVVISASSTPGRTGGHGVVAVAVNTFPVHTAALAWGAREAAQRKARLKVVHVVPADAGTPSSAFSAAGATLDGAVQPLRDQYPDTSVDVEVLAGSPIDELVALSRTVDLLILGVHPERLRGLGRGLLAHSCCPVGLTR